MTEIRSTYGNVLGERGLRTREKLLDATEAVLRFQAVPIHEVKVTTIAREARTSPATFYQHFKDLEEGLAACVERLAENARKKFKPGQFGGDESEKMVSFLIADVLEFVAYHRSVISAAVAIGIDRDHPCGVAVEDLLAVLGRQFADAAGMPEPDFDIRLLLWTMVAFAQRYDLLVEEEFRPMRQAVLDSALVTVMYLRGVTRASGLEENHG
jgi:AcrR family transcriptional regulator